MADREVAQRLRLSLPMVALGVLGLECVVHQGWAGGGAPFLIGFACVGGLWAEAIARRPDRLLRRLAQKMERKVELHLVTLKLFREGIEYGGDVGYVRFDRGLLRYGGLGTRFSLKPADATLLPDAFEEGLGVPASGSLDREEAWAFDLTAHPEIRVELVPIPVPDRPSSAKPLFRWLVDAPAATGESILPPLDRHPGYRKVREIRLRKG